MGAQAAALLDAGGPVGEVPPPFAPAAAMQLDAPAGYDLARTARSHGGVGLAPHAWDGARLHTVLSVAGAPVRVVVDADLQVQLDRPADPAAVTAALRTVLALDDDLGPLHDACDRVPALAWVRRLDAGRLLRSPTAWQDLVGVLAATNASYAATRRMVASVVEDAFPGADELAQADLSAWGYRAAALRETARRVAAGDVDPERWRDPAVPDDEVLAELRALPGIGPFAAAQLLPLLGPRPRPVVRDAWLERQVDVGALAPLGRWAGSGAWLLRTARRGTRLP